MLVYESGVDTFLTSVVSAPTSLGSLSLQYQAETLYSLEQTTDTIVLPFRHNKDTLLTFYISFTGPPEASEGRFTAHPYKWACYVLKWP